MSREEIISFVGQDWDAVRKLMRQSLSTDIALLADTNGSLLANGGKMVRPLLTLLMARACGKSNDDSVIYAAAVEMLHNATLLHDDVADQSAERRGIPTVNALLGSGAAVLLGDFWLARCVELVLTGRTNRKVISLFSKTLTDLAEGEMLQLEKAGSADTTESEYFRIIYCKTASLFEAAAKSGAESVEAPAEYLSAAGEYARWAGTAFQIKDDILDYAGDGQLGKPVGIDLREGKITLPLLCAMEGSPREGEIRSLVREVGPHPENVEKIQEFVLAEGGIGKAAGKLEEYIGKAVSALSVLPDGKAKDCLAELVKYNVIRVK